MQYEVSCRPALGWKKGLYDDAENYIVPSEPGACLRFPTNGVVGSDYS